MQMVTGSIWVFGGVVLRSLLMLIEAISGKRSGSGAFGREHQRLLCWTAVLAFGAATAVPLFFSLQ